MGVNIYKAALEAVAAKAAEEEAKKRALIFNNSAFGKEFKGRHNYEQYKNTMTEANTMNPPPRTANPAIGGMEAITSAEAISELENSPVIDVKPKGGIGHEVPTAASVAIAAGVTPGKETVSILGKEIDKTTAIIAAVLLLAAAAAGIYYATM